MSHTKELFFDHASTTPLHPDALGVMLPYFGNHFGVPDPLTDLGRRSLAALEEARGHVADLIRARPGEIVFTASGTESNNLAILGAAYARGAKGRHVISSRVEHPSVLGPCRHLEQNGFRITWVEVDGEGRVSPESVADAIREDTVLISIMHANHVTGTVQPVQKIGALARSRGVAFHVDAVQSAGKIPISMEDLPADLLSISGHMLYGPKGVAALYIRESAEISPVMFGMNQERGIRPGSENVPGIVGFGMACLVAARDLDRNALLLSSLRDSFEQQVTHAIGGAKIHGAAAERLPHLSCISFEDVPGGAVSAYLSSRDMIVSSGMDLNGQGEAICSVLEALGEDPQRACGALRVSLGWENKEREIRALVEGLQQAVGKSREFTSASAGHELGFITFPDQEQELKAMDCLEGKGFPYTLMARPDSLACSSGFPVALCTLARDQEEIGSLLGELGIEIRGMHKTRPRCRVMEKKEREFWGKVDQIRKGIR